MRLRIAALLSESPSSKARGRRLGGCKSRTRNAAWRDFGQQPFGAGLFWGIAAPGGQGNRTTIAPPTFPCTAPKQPSAAATLSLMGGS